MAGELRAGVLLLLIGALVAGCSDDEPQSRQAAAKEPTRTTEPAKERAESPRPPDLRDQGRDLAWLGRLHRWEVNVAADATKVESVSRAVQRGGRGQKALREPLVQLSRCEKNLIRQVGVPAASRYRPGYDLLTEACQTLKGISLQLIQALATDDPPPKGISKDGKRSRILFRRGTSRLEASMRANRSLPLAVEAARRARSSRG